jgi:hypothetical protein
MRESPMMQSIEGIYRNGVIELLEVPQDILESRVIVNFLPPPPKVYKMITFGCLKNTYETTDEDFASAEFHGDSDDYLDWS